MEREFRFTPKGSIVASLLPLLPEDEATDMAEVILEGLYQCAVRNAEKGTTPALVFIDGRWEWAGLLPEQKS